MGLNVVQETQICKQALYSTQNLVCKQFSFFGQHLDPFCSLTAFTDPTAANTSKLLFCTL